MAQRGVAPTSFFGGKVSLAPRIAALFPPHAIYVEPYLGAGSVYFSKAPAPISILNDVDGLLVNFFRVLRDPQKGVRLREALTLTLYAREEWADARLGLKAAARGWDEAADDVELARRWFVLTQMSFAGRITNAPAHEAPGWRYAVAPGRNPAQSYRSAIDRLPHFTAALANAQIEHDDALAVIARYDGKRVCQYLDPPYLPETRSGGGYGHEMTREEHERLLDLITTPKLRSMVVLSGYDSALYRERLERGAGWQRLEIVTTTAAAGRTRASKLQGEGAVYAAGQTRTEILWLNPAAQARQGLWAALESDLPVETAAETAAEVDKPEMAPPTPRRRAKRATTASATTLLPTTTATKRAATRHRIP